MVVATGLWVCSATLAQAQEMAPAGAMATSPPPAPPAAQAAPLPPPSAEPPAAQAKPRPEPNSIYFEGLGAGWFYSINYERLVIDQLAVRVGFGYVRFGASAGSAVGSWSWTSIPITASYIGIRRGSSALELGAGATVMIFSGSGSTGGIAATGSGVTAVGSALVGYRLHPVGHPGFQFRIGLMTLFGKGVSFASDANPYNFGAIPWGYISFGASF